MLNIFYLLHFSPIFILLTCNIPVISMYMYYQSAGIKTNILAYRGPHSQNLTRGMDIFCSKNFMGPTQYLGAVYWAPVSLFPAMWILIRLLHQKPADSAFHLQFWAYGSWDSLFPISMSPNFKFRSPEHYF